MPRIAGAIEAGLVYRVLNRGNGPMRLFRKDEGEGLEHYPAEPDLHAEDPRPSAGLESGHE